MILTYIFLLFGVALMGLGYFQEGRMGLFMMGLVVFIVAALGGLDEDGGT